MSSELRTLIFEPFSTGIICWSAVIVTVCDSVPTVRFSAGTVRESPAFNAMPVICVDLNPFIVAFSE